MKALSMPFAYCQRGRSPLRIHHQALTFICTCGDRDLSLGIQFFAKERRVCVCNSLPETGAALNSMSTCVTMRGVGVVYLCRGILVAFNSVERILRSINGKLGRVIATAHMYLKSVALLISHLKHTKW